ncbi:hypothetical protein JHJ32_06570 [Parapedobacter sp. ISTM3]|uniref:WYL domain-containing protein n=1 Tax=Parapedobacter luteus TaxID=623280 RepID=A0A1T5BAU0_9SPHI|nr:MULTISPECIES: hypothetical protein [Parapedobacter]MBK1439642.1 hypothetical protein [Parapedobacter sp. ISTM3]SKB44368.1 hypothetical protein SAMN05660226_01343 [Parapedobacter luteus]
MATNKQAAIRYKVLDMCLANTHRKYTFDDLLEACNERLVEINPSHGGISVRTLRDDLKYMRSAEGWEAPIETYRAGKTTYWINELVPTLTQTFLLEKRNLPIIGFDTNQYLRGREHIGSLFHHILYKRVVAFTYHPALKPIVTLGGSEVSGFLD